MEPPSQAPSLLIRNRDFTLLFSDQVISLTGSGVTTVGLALFAHNLVLSCSVFPLNAG